MYIYVYVVYVQIYIYMHVAGGAEFLKNAADGDFI